MKSFKSIHSVSILALSGLAAGLMAVVLLNPLSPPNSTLDTNQLILIKKRIRFHHQMTLQEVENQTGVPVDVLLEELSLPPNISPDSHLGRLSKIYGFDLEAVHTIVDRYEESGQLP